LWSSPSASPRCVPHHETQVTQTCVQGRRLVLCMRAACRSVAAGFDPSVKAWETKPPARTPAERVPVQSGMHQIRLRCPLKTVTMLSAQISSQPLRPPVWCFGILRTSDNDSEKANGLSQREPTKAALMSAGPIVPHPDTENESCQIEVDQTLIR
jgi:hypothetical protein